MIPEGHSICSLRDLTSGVVDIAGPEAVSSACGTTPDSVSRWQSGETVPDDDQLERLLVCSELVGVVAEDGGKDAAVAWLTSVQDVIQADNFEQARALAHQAALSSMSASWHCCM